MSGCLLEAVTVDGLLVCVPCVSITFREEKYDDLQGPREATDVPQSEGYARYNSRAFGIYRLLVLTGVFSMFDPIKHAHVGENINMKPGCCEYILFCDVCAIFG